MGDEEEEMDEEAILQKALEMSRKEDERA